MLCASTSRQSYIYSKPLSGQGPAAMRAEALGTKEPPHPRPQEQSIKLEMPPQL